MPHRVSIRSRCQWNVTLEFEVSVPDRLVLKISQQPSAGSDPFIGRPFGFRAKLPEDPAALTSRERER